MPGMRTTFRLDPARLLHLLRIAASAAAGAKVRAAQSHCTEVAARHGGGRARSNGAAPARTDAAAG
jgi:hypothetical protein